MQLLAMQVYNLRHLQDWAFAVLTTKFPATSSSTQQVKYDPIIVVTFDYASRFFRTRSTRVLYPVFNTFHFAFIRSNALRPVFTCRRYWYNRTVLREISPPHSIHVVVPKKQLKRVKNEPKVMQENEKTRGSRDNICVGTHRKSQSARFSPSLRYVLG